MEKASEICVEVRLRFFLFILCALLLTATTVTPMRPLITDAQENLVESFQTRRNIEPVIVHAEEADAEKDLNCENYIDKEDCDLNRRTLAAHTDYIYTQHHGHP